VTKKEWYAFMRFWNFIQEMNEKYGPLLEEKKLEETKN
jgi:hypothetical protein